MSQDYEYKLSVVVIVYNTEEFIEECLDSLVNQTLKDIEIICVNDESTDNSLNILKQYARKYDNIRIINQKNQGGAVAGNNGLKQAKGEYVAILDSDDVVVEDAYEKMYNIAKKTDSDIVGGKPNKYINGFLREISIKHNIWLEERTINPDVDFDIYHDVFYWDKIYRRELMEKNDVYMIPGKLYADAPMVFKAYFYAKKITLIPDVVYYWRKRSENTSITKSLLDIDNMKDRLVTYYYLRDYFKKAKKQDLMNDFIKIYFERFFYPIEGILMDDQFKDAYLKEVYAILSDIPDIYNNDVRITYNLYTYFILNDMIDDLVEFMMFYEDDREILIEDGVSYWNLKYFRNPDYNIPDELFAIDYIYDNFMTFESVKFDSDYFHLENIKIPETIDVDEAKLVFYGRTKAYNSVNDNIKVFKLTDDGKNSFSAKVPLDEIRNINVYDFYLKFKYNGRDELSRIKDKGFVEEVDADRISTNDYIIPHFSKSGNLVITYCDAKNLFKTRIEEDKLKFIPDTHEDINYDLYVESQGKFDRVYFDAGERELTLDCRYALDRQVEYKIYIELNKHSFKLRENHLKDFTDKTFNTSLGEIKLYKNDDGEIAIKLI